MSFEEIKDGDLVKYVLSEGVYRTGKVVRTNYKTPKKPASVNLHVYIEDGDVFEEGINITKFTSSPTLSIINVQFDPNKTVGTWHYV